MDSESSQDSSLSSSTGSAFSNPTYTLLEIENYSEKADNAMSVPPRREEQERRKEDSPPERFIEEDHSGYP